MNLNQVTVPSINLDASISFYDTLGLILIVHSGSDYARFMCPEGNASFSIHFVKQLAKGSAPIIYFECEDLDEKVLKLKEKGVVFEQEPTDQVWLWREARLRDPDGNMVVLYYAGENRLNPPWRLDGKK